MERRTKVFWIIFIIAVLVLFAIVYINLDFIQQKILSGIGTYGYPAVFVFTFIIDLAENPINTDIPAVIATILGLNVLFVFIFATAGDFLGLLTSFYVGRRYLSHRIRNSCSTDVKYKKYCKFFHKYGKLAVMLAIITPLPNILFVWFAGAFQLKLKDFFLYIYLPSMLRMGIVILIVSGIASLF